jgi:hypothetical protein
LSSISFQNANSHAGGAVLVMVGIVIVLSWICNGLMVAGDMTAGVRDN